MDLNTTFLRLGIALGLGLLVGLQRQRSASELAGIRTFPLVTLLGTLSALLADRYGGWVLAGGMTAVALALVIGNQAKIRAGHPDPGLTTEITMLLMYAVGAYLVVGYPPAAIAVAGSTAVLLQLKEPMHRMAERIGDADFRAITQFVLISLVILPVLPDRFYGPYQVLNPHQVWWMVVLIVGLSLGGYVAYKLLGERAGTLLAGVLGGLISSTATTVSYARRSRGSEAARRMAVVVILIASAVVFARVLLEVTVVARTELAVLAPPLAAMLGVVAALAAVAWSGHRAEGDEMPAQGNPSELKTALVFAALYAAVLLAVAAAREHFGAGGMFVVATLSGLTDMDAITLSTSQLVHAGRLDAGTGWRLILVASMSNLLFKLGTAGVLGGVALVRRLAPLFGTALAAGLALLWLW